MSFTVDLQTNHSDAKQLDKDVDNNLSVEGILRGECSLQNPIILLEADLDDVVGSNYCTVTTFGRSYFITDITSVRAGLVQISCKCDVLSSFASEIRANRGIVLRAEQPSSYNLYLNDGSLKAYQDPYVLTKPFPSGFTNTAFILAVAGG